MEKLVSSADSTNYAARLAELRTLMKKANLDAYLTASQYNRRYLTGFTPTDDDITESSGLVLVTGNSFNLVTGTFFLSSLEDEIIPSSVEVLLTDERSGAVQIAETLKRENVKRIGFEQDWFSVSRYQTVSEATDATVEWVATDDLVQLVRARKDETEVTKIRQAADLANRAFAQLITELHMGMSETQIAQRLDAIMLALGASEPSFKTIVACGPGGALPHAVPSDREVRVGEPLLIDFGCRLEGYCSDITRTICFGTPDPKLVEIYAAVRAAQDAAHKALLQGIRRGREIDAAAWQVLLDSGHISQSMHGLGHGVGLAVHELPVMASWRRAAPEMESTIATYEAIGSGAIITIEPGVYIPGWGGVRLEDMVLVRESGSEILTDRNPEQIISISV
jgi:Xaa-Pro aminopeptidase